MQRVELLDAEVNMDAILHHFEQQHGSTKAFVLTPKTAPFTGKLAKAVAKVTDNINSVICELSSSEEALDKVRLERWEVSKAELDARIAARSFTDGVPLMPTFKDLAL